jgi:hypothetical protein
MTAIALLLAAVAVRSWRHSGSTRVAFLAAAFAAFAAKGVLLSVGIFQDPDWEEHYILPSLLLDVLALALLYLAVLRKS